MQRKSLFKYILFIVISSIAISILCYQVVRLKTKDRTFSETEEVPYTQVALVLGTDSITPWGTENLYFKYRIEAAADLYHAGRISYLVVSGDNSKPNYNEPQMMTNALVRLGVPSYAIYQDYAGFRTLDSVVRCKKIFGQDTILVISQQFHNERALFLANCNDIYAIAFNAKNVSTRWIAIKNIIREHLARVKLFLDIIFAKSPKFIGDSIHIGCLTDCNDNRPDSTLLDLFYGMERHYSKDNNRCCVLDTISGVVKLEKTSTWRCGGDPCMFEASLCVYTDSIFPSLPILKQVTCNIDSMLQTYFVEYCTEDSTDSLDHIKNCCMTTNDILNYCSAVFNFVDSRRKTEYSDSLYSVLPLRVSLVASRIYNDNNIATYIFESSVDYNGSSGCPSGAYYCSFDKRTGKKITYDDIFIQGSTEKINEILNREHARVYKEKYDSDYYNEVSIFANKQESVAIVKEGVLFYYEPYTIGTGGEGQYNLILTPDMTFGLLK